MSGNRTARDFIQYLNENHKMSEPNSQLGPFDFGDEKLIAEIITSQLESEGYQVTVSMYDERSQWKEVTHLYLSTDNPRVRLAVFSPWHDTYKSSGPIEDHCPRPKDISYGFLVAAYEIVCSKERNV